MPKAHPSAFHSAIVATSAKDKEELTRGSRQSAREEEHMQKRERQLVNHNALAVGAILCILALMIMFNAAFTPRAPITPSSPDSLASPSSSPASGSLAGANPSSLSVPVDTGIYVCRSDDMADCTSFCSQVHLAPKRCMIKLSQRALDSSLCACSASE